MENEILIDLYNFALSRKYSGIYWNNDMFLKLLEEIIKLKKEHEGFLLEDDYTGL